MTSRTALARIASLVKSKRRGLKIGLREASRESGISPSTLSRLERNLSTSMPETQTLTSLATWLEMPVSSLIGAEIGHDSTSQPTLRTQEQVQFYLRSDKNLKPETAEALSKMFNILYEQFTTTPEKGESD